MKLSLSTRINRAIFLISFGMFILALVAVETIFNDIERSILDIEHAREWEYFQHQIDRPDYQQWQTARLTVAFLGNDQPESRLPAIFHGREPPYSMEVEVMDQTYLISSKRADDHDGVLYLAQNITVQEDRELLVQIAVITIGILMTIALLIFSRLATRRLVQPLLHLTDDIQRTTPEKAMRRLSTDYSEAEYIQIAAAFNCFLDALESFINRETTFVNLASHELQTPVAVITGALDVIERRDRLSPEDRHTIARIRRTATEMKADVEVLLELARKSPATIKYGSVNVVEVIENVIADLEASYPSRAGRVSLLPQSRRLILHTDPALLRMLLRNLIQNALKHTRSQVQILVEDDGFRLTDFGGGLPEAVVQRLREPVLQQPGGVRENSFGLLISQLICERLHWTLMVTRSDDAGTELVIRGLGVVKGYGGIHY